MPEDTSAPQTRQDPPDGEEQLVSSASLVEEVSIDGMCGVY
ncbi:mycofactocin precursor MftA [Candidatus Mycolicibacterium alkanivorans]|uniref:Mycofactocin MftA n=1 Tax=Candidatus Mycolicibacterium alkanivorans TaxID=2954114 RepID=A0ABS9YYP9_9MYCO|nr:mycofactocin precursor MftA [Candidatus Mycolicibacterium alkanivorans]MCI4676355.1 mycofactocin precursor MftA [Candidatus Mycolicibacterium alkanivorans]